MRVLNDLLTVVVGGVWVGVIAGGMLLLSVNYAVTKTMRRIRHALAFPKQSKAYTVHCVLS